MTVRFILHKLTVSVNRRRANTITIKPEHPLEHVFERGHVGGRSLTMFGLTDILVIESASKSRFTGRSISPNYEALRKARYSIPVPRAQGELKYDSTCYS